MRNLTSNKSSHLRACDSTLAVCLASCLVGLMSPAVAVADDAEAIDVGSRLEMFVDHHLIDQMENTRLKLHTPRDAGKVRMFDKPWEGAYAGYLTVIQND